MLATTLLTVACAALASAHIVISYPGWRGNNLITNETFPYGMQWMYPCECPAPPSLPKPLTCPLGPGMLTASTTRRRHDGVEE